MYDAMNKGIAAASGHIIGILNSDDFYADKHVLTNVAKSIHENRVDSCYGDVIYVDRNNVNRVVRYWRAGGFARDKFRFGWMPPHPTFFCKREIYDKYGLLMIDFPLAADYELMLRLLLKHGISVVYIPQPLVKMRTGGTSRPGAYTIGSMRENHNAWRVNKLRYPLLVLLKPFLKISQYWNRPTLG